MALVSSNSFFMYSLLTLKLKEHRPMILKLSVDGLKKSPIQFSGTSSQISCDL